MMKLGAENGTYSYVTNACNILLKIEALAYLKGDFMYPPIIM